jgi:hypothetical protein
MASPLVRQLGLQALLKRDAAEPPAPQDISQDVWPALAGHVRAAWGRNKLAKQQVDLHLLDCLRARRAVYSPAQISVIQQAGGGANIVFTKLTETKCRAGSAWIRDIVLPVGERPWGLEPTPISELPKELMDMIANKAEQQAQEVMVAQYQQAQQQTPDGQVVPTPVMSPQDFKQKVFELKDKLRTECEARVTKLADIRAKRMERQIDDRLAEGGWAEAMDAFVEDFVTYPAAIMKGPVYQRVQTLTWESGWVPKVSNDPKQCWEQVSPFDVYPAPSAKDAQKGDFIERMRLWRNTLFDLKGLPGFQDDQIDKALRDYSGGHLEGWLWTEAERQRLTQESMYMWLSPPGVIDALNYWGAVPGWQLMSWGVEGIDEPTRDYECNVILIGRYVVYAALNSDPLSARPYRKACYDEIPGAFWGCSVPDLAGDCQKFCNAIARAMADNLSMASGPQVWVHADRFADGENSIELYPWKVWQLKSDPTQGVNPGIGFFQPPDNSANLNAAYEKWEMRADDATGIPRYTYGNERVGGAGDTASGLAMLLNSAAKGLRRAISNIDMHVIGPNIFSTFVNEMLYNPDESIKGDCKAVPRGAAAILIKDSAQQRRIQFLGMTANPIDMQIIGVKGRAAVLREVANSMELDTDAIVPSEEQLEQQQEAAAQAQAQQQQAMMQAEGAKMQAEQQGQMAIEQQKIQGQKEIAQMKGGAAQQDVMTTLIADIVKANLASKSGAEQPQAIMPKTGLEVARSAV